jgi:hypothetical protein
MTWILGIFISLILLFGFFYWSGRRFNPEGNAKNTARAMLSAFNTIEKTNRNLRREELYRLVLKTRPTCTDEETVEEILSEAKSTAKEEKKELALWMVTLWLVMHEYQTFRSNTSAIPGRIPHALEYLEHFYAGVTQIIPEDV